MRHLEWKTSIRKKDGHQPLAPCDQVESRRLKGTQECVIHAAFKNQRKLGKIQGLISELREFRKELFFFYFQLLLHNPTPQRRHSVGKVCAEARKVWERARPPDVSSPGPKKRLGVGFQIFCFFFSSGRTIHSCNRLHIPSFKYTLFQGKVLQLCWVPHPKRH